jgi:hypothetical protein
MACLDLSVKDKMGFVYNYTIMDLGLRGTENFDDFWDNRRILSTVNFSMWKYFICILRLENED